MLKHGDNVRFGFDTRVVAQWMEQPVLSLRKAWEFASLRFLMGACAIMIICMIGSNVSVANTQDTTPELDVIEDAITWTFAP